MYPTDAHACPLTSAVSHTLHTRVGTTVALTDTVGSGEGEGVAVASAPDAVGVGVGEVGEVVGAREVALVNEVDAVADAGGDAVEDADATGDAEGSGGLHPSVDAQSPTTERPFPVPEGREMEMEVTPVELPAVGGLHTSRPAVPPVKAGATVTVAEPSVLSKDATATCRLEPAADKTRVSSRGRLAVMVTGHAPGMLAAPGTDGTKMHDKHVVVKQRKRQKSEV